MMTESPEGRRRHFLRWIRDNPWKTAAAFFVLAMIVGSVEDDGPGGSVNSADRRPDRAVEVVSSRWAETEYGGRAVVGKIRNTGREALDYVQVEVRLTDGTGNVVGSTLDNVGGLDPGQTWRFEAIVTEERARDYEITGVTGR